MYRGSRTPHPQGLPGGAAAARQPRSVSSPETRRLCCFSCRRSADPTGCVLQASRQHRRRGSPAAGPALAGLRWGPSEEPGPQILLRRGRAVALRAGCGDSWWVSTSGFEWRERRTRSFSEQLPAASACWRRGACGSGAAAATRPRLYLPLQPAPMRRGLRRWFHVGRLGTGSRRSWRGGGGAQRGGTTRVGEATASPRRVPAASPRVGGRSRRESPAWGWVSGAGALGPLATLSGVAAVMQIACKLGLFDLLTFLWGHVCLGKWF